MCGRNGNGSDTVCIGSLTEMVIPLPGVVGFS
jgi:hypothetical protein